MLMACHTTRRSTRVQPLITDMGARRTRRRSRRSWLRKRASTGAGGFWTGCGPGILIVRLARLFDAVVGLDPDADMLTEGRRAAERQGLTNINWIQALAEELPAAAPGPYRVVTFGLSFHWTNEQRVAEDVYDILEPGGVLALIVHTVSGRPEPPSPGPPPIPHAEIRGLVARHLGSNRRAGQGVSNPRTHRFEDVLARTRFGEPRVRFLPGIPDLTRDSESVLSDPSDRLTAMSFTIHHSPFTIHLREIDDLQHSSLPTGHSVYPYVYIGSPRAFLVGMRPTT